MNEASASPSRIPTIDRGTLPASLRDKGPIASFFLEDVRPFLDPGIGSEEPFSARIVLWREIKQATMPRVQSGVQIFGAPSRALSTREGWEDVPEGFFLHFLDWLNTLFGVPIACRGAAVQQGGLLGQKRAKAICEESNLPVVKVHEFEAGIWMTLAPLHQLSAHAALGLHQRQEIEYLDPSKLVF